MNDNVKKIGLIAISIVALGIAIFAGVNLLNSDKPQVDKVIQIPEGSRSMKEIEMEKQNAQANHPIAGGAPVPSADQDLGGSLGSGGGGKEGN